GHVTIVRPGLFGSVAQVKVTPSNATLPVFVTRYWNVTCVFGSTTGGGVERHCTVIPGLKTLTHCCALTSMRQFSVCSRGSKQSGGAVTRARTQRLVGNEPAAACTVTVTVTVAPGASGPTFVPAGGVWPISVRPASTCGPRTSTGSRVAWPVFVK